MGMKPSSVNLHKNIAAYYFFCSMTMRSPSVG